MTQMPPDGPPMSLGDVPAEEDIDLGEVAEELEQDPTSVPSFPETHPDHDADG